MRLSVPRLRRVLLGAGFLAGMAAAFAAGMCFPARSPAVCTQADLTVRPDAAPFSPAVSTMATAETQPNAALPEKWVCLTFDDGPNARYTPMLLDELKKRNIRASFFLIGENIEGNEDILLQMRKDGHLIGNHTWDHVQLDKIPAEKARLEIEKTNNRIYEASGIYPSYVRPPFGAWIKDMELSVTMLPVFWDVDTLDWKSKNIDSILSIAQKQVHDGSIILMHDSYQTSVDAALKIADLFTEKGYVFVTADQLLLT